jgi:hypothetical protein
LGFVFALMSIAGARAAWHHSPVYAGQSGLRALGLIVLFLAAAVFTVVATVHFIQPLSAALQFVIMGLLVIGLTLGLVFSIQAVTIPKASRLITSLPKSVRTLTVHRDHFYRWAKYAVGFLAVSGAGLLIPGTARYVFAGLGGICLLLTAVTLPLLYIGHDGLYCNGRFLTWLGGDYYLTDASIDARPPRSMQFRFEKLVPNPYGPLQTIVLFQSVLIPDGTDGEIARLSHELVTRCPGAHISLA